MAGAAGAVQHDIMLGDLERDATRDARDRALELGIFERRDPAAFVADEVVVVVAAGMDGLVAHDALPELDPRDQLELLELIEDAVHTRA